MGCIKKYLLIITLLILIVKPTNAQLFKRPDSVSVWSAFSVGIGGYYGINQYKPQTEGLIYFNQSGYDQGVIGRIQLKVTRHWLVFADYRLVRKTGLIVMSAPAMAEQFMLNSTGHQLQLSTAYRFTTLRQKNEIVTIYGGITRNSVTQLATNIVIVEDSPITGSGLIRDPIVGSDYFKNGPTQVYYSITLGLSRDFKLTNKFSITPFYEVEGKKDAVMVENSARYPGGGPSISYTALYSQFNYRLGVFFNY